MNRSDFLRVLEEVFEEEEGTLKGDELLSDLIWDSLTMVSFISVADEHLNATVKPADLTKAKSLSDLLKMVEEHFD